MVEDIRKLPYKYRIYLNKYSKEFCTMAVKKASKLLAKKMRYAISKYYGEYDPYYYDRTDNFKDNAFKEYTKLYGKTYEGGIKLNASYLDTYKNKGLSMDDIYYRTMWKGEHGQEKLYGHSGVIKIKKTNKEMKWNNWRPIIISASPYDRIYDYLNNSTKLIKECSVAGFKAANKIKL